MNLHLNNFANWLAKHRDTLAEAGFYTEIKIPNEESNNRSARVDLESANQLARITVWEDGLCDFEVLFVDPKKPGIFEHFELAQERSIDDQLAPFLLRLKDWV